MGTHRCAMQQNLEGVVHVEKPWGVGYDDATVLWPHGPRLPGFLHWHETPGPGTLKCVRLVLPANGRLLSIYKANVIKSRK